MSKNVTLGYLGYNFQVSLINQILHPANKKFADRIMDIIHSKYFDNEYFRLIISTLKDYNEKFEKVPTWDTLETVLRLEIKDKVTSDYIFSLLKEIKELNVEDWEFIQEKALNFCRQQELKKANEKITKIIQDGDFDSYEQCSEILKDALSVGADKDDGTSITDDIEGVLEKNFRDPIPTGIKGIDDITSGGLARGELGCVIAPLGVGKSSMLTKIANTAYNTGHNVLQIVFEDLEPVIKRKHFACWSGIDLSELDSDENKEFVIGKVKEMTHGKTNDLVIRKFPSEGTTINHIKTYVRHLISTGFKPDVIILDYIDVLESTKSNESGWEGEGSITRGFENLVYENQMVGWFATQGNRFSISSELVTGDQMGGSIKKAQIAHFIVSVAKTLPQKEARRANIAILKSRFGKDGIVYENCVFDNGKIIIDTETSDTFLGYETQKEEEKEQKAIERIKKARELREKNTSNN